MKRLFYLAVLVFMVTTASAQSFETPICYALRGADATLKYRFKYDEGKFYTCFRIYEKPGNALKPGDKIIMENVDEEVVEYQITEQVIHDSGDNDFYQVETDYNQLVLLQRKLKKITLIRENVTETPKLTAYCKTCTVNGAKEVVCNATRIEREKELLTVKRANVDERIKLLEAKAAAIDIEKNTGAHLSYYNRFFVGYAPTYIRSKYGSEDYEEGLTFGYTRGLRLNIEKMIYFEFGTQFDFIRSRTYDDNDFMISIPLAFTGRIALGPSRVTMSPFLGPIFKFCVTEKDKNIFQIGVQGGLNIDYNHLNCGVGYHADFWMKDSPLAHARGLYIRLGYTF